MAVGLAFVFFWVVICCLLSFRLLPYQTPFLFFFFSCLPPSLSGVSSVLLCVCVCVYREFVVVAATVLFLGRIWVLASKVHISISLGLRVTKLFTYN